MGYIYVITNKINGKKYVGKTARTIEERWKEHIKNSKIKKFDKMCPLYSAINKYGIENFTIEQIEECSYEMLNEREKYWINELDTYSKAYNATRGGDGHILYDYKEIADKYLELGSIKATAQYIGCSRDTVHKACINCGVKISSTQKMLSKPVIMIDKTTNKIIQTFPSAIEAGRQTGIGHSHISSVCRGERKTAGGYVWKYV